MRSAPVPASVLALACATAVLVPPVLGARAAAQPVPTADDEALLAPLLEGRVDVEPERVVYVAPLPGEDGDGSRERPRRDLIRVVAEAEAGTAIHLAPGVYAMSVIRDTFGHTSSRLITNEDGERGRPIVLRTDPELYDPASAIAILDFDYANTGDWSSSAFVARNDFWVFERFEIRRVRRRAFSVAGRECTLRELELHHADTDGTDNDALIVMMTSGAAANVVVLRNHLHHVGIIDHATDELVEIAGVNSGCYYSVTRLSYDSGTPAAGHDATRAEWEAELEPADGHVYVVANHAHDCHYGLGLKNLSRGPYFFLSNLVHDADYGIFSPFRETIVRGNVIHDVGVGIRLGRAQTDGPLMTYLKMTGNGAHSEVDHNTVVGARVGLEFSAGWGTVVRHNLVVGADEPVAIVRNQFAWYDGGAWPGIRGEYLLGDLDSTHPFFELVPGYAREDVEDYRVMSLTGNCYDAEPVVARADFTQPVADITGMAFDRDYQVLDDAARAGLFLAESEGDYRRADDGYTCGALLTGPVAPELDAGVSVDASAPGADGALDTDAGMRSGPSGEAASGGCGCATGRRSDAAPWMLLTLLGVVVIASRRARRARRGSSGVFQA